MNYGQTHEEVNEANFSYLFLAQQMIQQDITAAAFCLGISREKAELVARINPAQYAQSSVDLSAHAAC